MRSKIARICALIPAVLMLAVLVPASAHADSLRIVKVRNLKAQVQSETRDPDGALLRPAAVTLTWRVRAHDTPDPFLGDRKITIRRGPDRDNVWEAPVIHTIPGPSTEGENLVMTWTDESVRPGETYFYRVESGRFSPYRHATVRAAVPGTLPAEESPAAGSPGKGPQQSMEERRAEYKTQISWPEKLAASVIAAIPNWLVTVAGLYDPLELIFMIDHGAPWQDGLPAMRDLPYWHVFSANEMQAVSVFYDGLAQFVPVWLVVAMVLLALGALYNTANPQSKLGLREYLLGFALSMLLLKFGAQMLGFVFDVNYALVKQFILIALPFLDAKGWGAQDTFMGALILADQNITIGDAIVAFIAALAIAVLNFQYIMRKINIALLVGLIPIVAVVSIAPAKRYALGIWFRELIANIFLQAAHAAVLAFLLLIIHASEADTQMGLYATTQAFWIKWIAILALVGLTGLVRSVIGAETVGSGPMGAAGAMFGVAGLLALGRMIRPAAGAAGAAGRAAAGGGPGGAGVAGAAGVARGLGTRIGMGALQAGGVITGAVAGGMIMGAATGDPDAGVAIGGALGTRGAGRVAGRSAGGDDPAQQALRNVFGRDMFSQSGLSNLREFSQPGYRAAASEARSHVKSAHQSLVSAKANLDAHKPFYDEARARLTEAKAMYSPKAAHLENVQKQFADTKSKLRAAEQQYLGILNIPEDSRGPSYDQDLEAAKAEQDQLRTRHAALEAKLDAAPQAYQDALANYQEAEAEHARRQQDVARAEQKLTHDALVKEFQNIKDRRSYRTPGGVNGPQWGP